MCGIFGQWNFHGNALKRSVFHVQRDTLHHRGPDSGLSWFNEKGNVGLAQQRLSIIDLDPRANQPLHNENNTVHAVVNGEIYNFKTLKTELEKAGHIFKTDSDSEIIVHGWEQWGVALPKRLKGMFAFTVYDENTQELFAARDPFGIKPFYYSLHENFFVFASELKAIIEDPEWNREVDWTSAVDFFVYRYIPSPKTIWKNISKLAPATYIHIKNNFESKIETYWEPSFNEYNIPFDEAVSQARELLKKSVSEHLLSDVPVGTFLSGGYDSTAITLMQHELGFKPKTFSIGFKNWERSEHQFAGIVSELFDTEHYQSILDKDDFSLLQSLAFHYDEPNGDISTIPTYQVSALASDKVKVVLSGEGADEIFGGYTWHNQLKNRFQFWDKNIVNNYRNGNPMSGVSGYTHAMAMGLFNQDKLKELFSSKYHQYISDNPFWFYKKHFRNDLSPLKAFQYLDIKTFMGELVLQKVDRASMAHSLEARVPFLDTELVNFMLSLHENVYFKKGVQKAVLKKILEPQVPDLILNRQKQGFTGPDSFYQDISVYKKYLQNSVLVEKGIINRSFIDNGYIQHDFWRLWKVLIFEMWYKKWII